MSLKKNSPKPRKQKKKRAKVVGWQDHRIGPGSGSLLADKVWTAIKRAQPNHRERTTSEIWDRCARTSFGTPYYTPAEVMACKND
jgi:hypothetical protein